MMTNDDINKIAKIMLTADNFCSNCQGSLLGRLKLCYPEFSGEIDEILSKAREYENALSDAKDKYWDEVREPGTMIPEPEIWEIRLS